MKTCAICNKEFKNLGSHVFQAHQITIAEYDNIYNKTDDSTTADLNLAAAKVIYLK